MSRMRIVMAAAGAAGVGLLLSGGAQALPASSSTAGYAGEAPVACAEFHRPGVIATPRGLRQAPLSIDVPAHLLGEAPDAARVLAVRAIILDGEPVLALVADCDS